MKKMSDIDISVQHGGQKIVLTGENTWSIHDLKLELVKLLNVEEEEVKRMKIICKGKVRGDDDTFESCGIKPPKAKVVLFYTAQNSTKPPGNMSQGEGNSNTGKAEGTARIQKETIELSLGSPIVITLTVRA